MHEDGGGLRLVVDPSGARRWVSRLTITGRRVNRGLGSFPLVSLDAARDRATDLRRAAKAGRDVRAEEKAEAAKAVTFREAFEAMFAVRQKQLSNAKHLAQWSSTMEAYAFPRIGGKAVGEVTHADVLAILEPIWWAKPETAKRVLQRLEAVFKSAILRGNRAKASPCIGVADELGRGNREVEHHRAMPWRDVPAFVVRLQGSRRMLATRLARADEAAQPLCARSVHQEPRRH